MTPLPTSRPTARSVLIVLGLVGLLTTAFTVARANAQQPTPDTQTRLLASRTPDRADPVPLEALEVAEGAAYVFAEAPPQTAWVAFYLDLTDPGQLAEPDQVERQAPFDLAGTTQDGQATPLEVAALEPGTHRLTAILHTPDGGQELLTSTFQIEGAASTPAPTPTVPPSTTEPSVPPTSGPPEPDTPQQQQFGVHQDLHYGVRDGAIQAAQQLGATVSRSSFLWDKIESEPGALDWSSADAFINQLVTAGMEPLLYFVGSPAWANGSDDRFVVPTEEAEFQQWVTEYAQFAQAAAERYRGQVTRWQVGNEQNQSDFWRPQPSPDRYRTWYVAMRDAILAGNPDAEVSLGGLAGLTASGETTGLAFLRELIEADTPIDVVSVHPYPGQGQSPTADVEGENDFSDIQLVRQLLQDAGLADVPLWVTEWGWSSSQVGEATQADYIANSVRQLRAEYPYVAVATYFLDYDRPEFDHGLLRSDLSAKPAATAFTDAVQEPAG